jgi:hypothetical protein
MTTLKITDREEVLRRVLTEAFKPRFGAIGGAADNLLRKLLAKDHPRFIELLADKTASAYLATSSSKEAMRLNAEGEKIKLAAPVYGVLGSEPTQHWYSCGEKLVRLCTESIVPCGMGDFVIADAKFLKTYSQAWADYEAAWYKLASVLASYKTREKLIADFPEFEVHLPELTVPAKLPAVIVKDVRRDLKKLGVPAVVAAA